MESNDRSVLKETSSSFSKKIKKVIATLRKEANVTNSRCVSDGESGITLLRVISEGDVISEWREELLNCGIKNFTSLSGVINNEHIEPTFGEVYEVIIFEGRSLPKESRSTINVLNVAKNNNLSIPNCEVMFLVWKYFLLNKKQCPHLVWLPVIRKELPSYDFKITTMCRANEGTSFLMPMDVIENHNFHVYGNFIFTSNR